MRNRAAATANGDKKPAKVQGALSGPGGGRNEGAADPFAAVHDPACRIGEQVNISA